MPKGAVGWCIIKERERQRQKPLHRKQKNECEICWLQWNHHLDLLAKRTERRDTSSYRETLPRIYLIVIFKLLLHSRKNCFPSFWDLRPPSGRCCHPHPYLVALPGVETDVFLLTSALPTLSFLLQGGVVNRWKYFQIVTLALIYLGEVNKYFFHCLFVKKRQNSDSYLLDGKVFRILQPDLGPAKCHETPAFPH